MARLGLVLACGLALTTSFGLRAVRRQNDQIVEEVAKLRQLLHTSAGQTSKKVRLAQLTGPALGNFRAPVTIVEFADLLCPFCRQFHATTFERIKKEYVDTGMVRYVSHDFPLDAIHPQAIAAARAARCAGAEGKFWEMRHAILSRPTSDKTDTFGALARELGLDAVGFDRCAAGSAGGDAGWRRDKADAESVGVSGTPTFVVGRTAAGGLEGVLVVGARPYEAFDTIIKELLSSSNGETP